MRASLAALPGFIIVGLSTASRQFAAAPRRTDFGHHHVMKISGDTRACPQPLTTMGFYIRHHRSRLSVAASSWHVLHRTRATIHRILAIVELSKISSQFSGLKNG
jgi:hypothetical protein